VPGLLAEWCGDLRSSRWRGRETGHNMATEWHGRETGHNMGRWRGRETGHNSAG